MRARHVVAWSLVMGLATARVFAGAQEVAQPGTATVRTAHAPLLEQVRQRLVQAPVLRGEFSQEKTIQGFKQPLRSSGRFVVAQGQGIVWQVQKPFVSTLKVTPDSLQSLQADGSLGFELQAQKEPALRAINSMLFAVMAADLAVLPQYFEISGQLQGADGWALTLIPRDKVLSQWLTKIELQGRAFVTQVRMEEAQGEVSVISMRNMLESKVLLGPDAQLFE